MRALTGHTFFSAWRGLVDSFVGNAHGLIIRKVGLQSVCNLLARPAVDSLADTTMRLIAANEHCLPRSGDFAALCIVDLALPAVLDALAQPEFINSFAGFGIPATNSDSHCAIDARIL